MRYILSPQGERALHSFIERDTLLAFDFDGTLAPIVPQPEAASAPTSINLAMSRLCEVATVAIITGRSIEDVRARLGFHPKYIVGNHGAEGLPGMASQPDSLPEIAAWEAQLRATWSGVPSGVHLENKGHSLTLHYRMTTHRESARQLLETKIQQLVPMPRRIGGKCVINLLPVNAADKFDALLALQRTEAAHHALFIGDDETDESVFRKALPQWLTIRVGRKVDSAASYYLNTQSEMAALIQRIDRQIRSRRKEEDR